MKKKQKRTFTQKCKAFLGEYLLGIDFWALGLFGVLLLPNFIFWCWQPVDLLLRSATQSLYFTSFVFTAIACAVLMFVRHEDEARDPRFSSMCFLFTCLFAALTLAGWAFYLANYVNWAVVIFLAVFPNAAMITYAILRRNYFALPLIAVSLALSIAMAVGAIGYL